MKLGIAVRLHDHQFYVNDSYVNYFKNLKFEVSILTLDSPLEDMDVIVLPGGYDIDPKYYHEENISSENIVDYNDILDFKLLDYAVKHDKKLLGICRGIQSINVYFGGTLWQDRNNHKKNNHFIKMNNRYLLVNSFHHQSIKKPGNGLQVLAKSLDGEIEIIQYKKIIGVQFHPERMNTPIINQIILHFINEV